VEALAKTEYRESGEKVVVEVKLFPGSFVNSQRKVWGLILSRKEQSGWKYKCTKNCFGRPEGGSEHSTAIVRRTNPSTIFLNGMTSTLTSSRGMTGAVARIAMVRLIMLFIQEISEPELL